MKKYFKVIAVVAGMLILAVACDKDDSSETLTNDLAKIDNVDSTDGDEVKRPGGGSN